MGDRGDGDGDGGDENESTLNDDDGGSNERQRRSKAEELDGSGKRTKELMGKVTLGNNELETDSK